MIKNKVGRPRKKEKVALMAAYLLPKERKEIVKKYGNLTLATRAHLLSTEVVKEHYL